MKKDKATLYKIFCRNPLVLEPLAESVLFFRFFADIN